MFEDSTSEKSPGGDQFVKRLVSLPIMATAISQLSSFYLSTKEKNRLLKLTMETAESGVGAIISTAVPVVSRFDKEIVALNNIACAQLDLLEHRCPIITKPTEEVVKETKELCCGAIQPVVNRVNSVKNYGYDTVSGIRTYTGDRMNGVKMYGMNKVAAAAKIGSDQVTRVLSIPVCRGVVNRFDAALDIADGYVDNYLPCESGVETSSEKASSDVILLSKAFHLGNKVQRRLYSRAVKRLKGMQLRTRQTISKLNYTVDLIEYARSNFNGAREKAQFYWQEINKMEDQVAEDATSEQIGYYDSNFERKALATARHLTTKLKRTFSWVVDTSFVASIPEVVRGKLGRLQDMVHSLSEIFSKETIRVKGLPRSALDSARSTMSQLYDSLSDLVEWTLKNTSNSGLISSLVGNGLLHGGAQNSVIMAQFPFFDESDDDSKCLEKTVEDSENQQQKEEEEKDIVAPLEKTEKQPAQEEDKEDEMTGEYQQNAEETEDEEEVEEEEDEPMSRCRGECDPVEQQHDAVRKDEQTDKADQQLKEEDVKDEQRGVVKEQGKDRDVREDLEKEDSEAKQPKEEDLD